MNDLLHHGWRKFWNLITWMPPKRFNFKLLERSSSPWLKTIFEIWWPESLQNTLISKYLNNLHHHGWRKFWNLMTGMPPNRFNLKLFEWSCSSWLKIIFEIWWLECLPNILISNYLNDLLHHGWRKCWNLVTWMPPKRFNFTLFEWSSSTWLKKILKFDGLTATRTL